MCKQGGKGGGLVGKRQDASWGWGQSAGGGGVVKKENWSRGISRTLLGERGGKKKEEAIRQKTTEKRD